MNITALTFSEAQEHPAELEQFFKDDEEGVPEGAIVIGVGGTHLEETWAGEADYRNWTCQVCGTSPLDCDYWIRKTGNRCCQACGPAVAMTPYQRYATDRLHQHKPGGEA
jgi:hypothetical protein